MASNLNAATWATSLLLLVLVSSSSGGGGGFALAKSAKSRQQSSLPSFVKVCHRNDAALDSCARKSLESLRDRFAVGIPELYIPPIEPLVIPEIKMDQDTGAIYMHSTYKNVQIAGLSNFTVNKMSIEPEKLKFSMCLSFPYVTLNARYNMQGKIMMMPLMGEGPCRANFTDVMLHTDMFGQEYKKKNKSHIKIKKIVVSYQLGKVQLHLDNLFNGDKALGERMNAFLNENWQSLSDEVKPLMQKALIDVIRSSTDKLFDAHSYDDLLPL